MDRVINVREVTKEYMENCYYKTIFNEICENIIYFFTFYPMLAMLNFHREKNLTVVFIGVISIVPILLSALIKRKLKIAWQSLLTYTLIYSIAAIVFYSLSRNFYYAVFFIPWLIRDIKNGKAVEKVKFNRNSIIASEAILAFSVLVCAILKLNELRRFIFMSAIILGLFSVIYLYKIRTDRLLVEDSIRRNVVNISDKYGKNMMISICTLGLIVVISIFAYMGLFYKAAAITDNMAALLTDGIDNMPLKEEQQEEMQQGASNGLTEMKSQNKEPSSIVKAIFAVLKVILDIITFGLKIFVALALMAMVYLVFNFLLLKLKTKNENDKIEYIYNSGKEEIKLRKRLEKYKDEIKEHIISDNRKEVRKLYRKKVLKYRGKKVILRNTFTVEEINNEIKNKTNDQLNSLSEIYEKARYSNKDISNLEVNKLKKSL